MCLAFVWLALPASGQRGTVSGTVVDSASGAPLPNVSVVQAGGRRGTLTDSKGAFTITVNPSVRRLLFSASGYRSVAAAVADTPLKISMPALYKSMGEVVVKSRRRYRNKNNPAVELIREVIAHKTQNAPSGYPFLTYDQYQKLRLLTDQPPRFIIRGSLLKRYRFLFDSPDTTLEPGKPLVPMFLEETSSRNYYHASPPRRKEVILGRNRVDLSGYIDAGGVSTILSRLYDDFSVYDNTMQVFTLQFMSPVADLGPTLYMYYIRDTVADGDARLVHLSFIPRNPEDLLFRGDLYITLDGSFAIRKAELHTTARSNLNWVRSFDLEQEFEKGPGNRYFRNKSRLTAFFSPLPKSRGFYGERTVVVTSVSDTALPETAFRGLPTDTTLASRPLPDSLWDHGRPEPLGVAEALTYAHIDSLSRMRSFKNMMNVLTLATVGYLSAGKFDIGRVGNFYSFNQLEGQRFQIGGRSNTKLSTRWFTDDYVAYGTADGRWKYNITATYSINHQSIYRYPFHFIQVGYQHDIRNPGQENEFSQNNSFLSSFSRGIGGKWLYSDVFDVAYVREFGDHFSYNFQFKYWNQTPTGSLAYVYEPDPGASDTVRNLTASQVSVTLGWAPHQQFYQGKLTRRTITNKYPVLTFQYSRGVRGLLGGSYNYDAFHASVSKRWYVAPFGFSDISLDVGYISGNLPFPLLVIHPANTAYFYSFSAYNLMNVAEFVSDHYAALDVEHYFNGFFLNKIPLLRRLRLREVVAGKLLYGGVRDENNPYINPSQMKFPALNTSSTTYALGSQPYLEASVGIYNIFNILRLDYVRRFTYLDHPGISSSGIRFSTSINF